MKRDKKDRCSPRGASRRKNRAAYPLEVRLKAVKLYLEEGMAPHLVSRELGIHTSSLFGWIKSYKTGGEAGLAPRRRGGGPTRRPASAIRQKITEVKRQNPTFGVKRISQWLRRVLFLPASPETVRRTLHRQGLMPKTRKKTPRNPPKPRFFERSTPNQMWQSDIFTFRLGGKNAYLIGFVDDYSRYVVGLDLFRSQTAEHVLEVYRTAVSEYGVPKEMLTDQGRQYANWRGKTRFQLELQKDRVHHLMSRPHHPMTLGKVERFWRTIWEEFLVRAQFGSFEEARDRVRCWVKYYNHKRPHQGLEGSCPADRFFEIQKELRKVIEQGIQENVQALALNRPPNEPFYMVGRMGGQSVVLSVEKGRFQMKLDEDKAVQEVDYQRGEKAHEQRGEQSPERAGQPEREGEGPGGAGVVDGAAEAGGAMPGDGAEVLGGVALAGAGDGGYARSPHAADTNGGAAAHAAEEGGETAGPQKPGTADEALPAAVEAANGGSCGDAQGVRRVDEAEENPGGREAAGPPEGGADRPGPERPNDGNGGRPPTGGVAEDLLPVGEACALGDGGGAPGEDGGPSIQASGSTAGEAAEAPGGTGGPGAGA
jgi:transposase InsO family protein